VRQRACPMSLPREVAVQFRRGEESGIATVSADETVGMLRARAIGHLSDASSPYLVDILEEVIRGRLSRTPAIQLARRVAKSMGIMRHSLIHAWLLARVVPLGPGVEDLLNLLTALVARALRTDEPNARDIMQGIYKKLNEATYDADDEEYIKAAENFDYDAETA
jgi:hypothetical protein